VSQEWTIDPDPTAECHSSETDLLNLEQAVDALRVKQNGNNISSTQNVKFYAVGDSVLRTCIADMLHVGHEETKYQCKKDVIEEKNPLLGTLSGRERQESCVIIANHVEVHFNWLQWLSAPLIRRNSNSPPVCNDQTTDFCTSHLESGGTLDSCLAHFFKHAKSSDFLIIRAGLQYVLFDSAWGDDNNCQALHLPASELRAALTSFPEKVKKAFPGKVIWWMMSPIVPKNQGVRCQPPLNLLDPKQIESFNTILESAARAAGFGVLVKPEKYLISDTKLNMGGYFDCLHFRSPGCRATFTLLFNIFLQMM